MRHLMWPAYEEAGLPEALLFGIMAKESAARYTRSRTPVPRVRCSSCTTRGCASV